MDIIWIALLGITFFLTVGLALGCEGLAARRGL
jgi:hypothetical protein